MPAPDSRDRSFADAAGRRLLLPMSRLFAICLLALVAAVGVGRATDGGLADETRRSARSLAARDAFEGRRPRIVPVPFGSRAAQIALEAVGTPYRWGGSSKRGFDCSGLVMWAYAKLGVALPHQAAGQAHLGRRVPRRRLLPGDLVFFSGYGHVGMYIGRGRMVHAPQSGERVRVERLGGNYGRRLVEARRIRS
jgi:cell wall-associated NlpC family hydrolase